MRCAVSENTALGSEVFMVTGKLKYVVFSLM